MRLCELELTNVRTFRSLELTLEAGAHVVWGMNGAGKTNLLESILLLATARQARGGSDIDLISWDSLKDDPLPAAPRDPVPAAAGPAPGAAPQVGGAAPFPER